MSSGYYANEDANGRGGFLNDLKGWVASCKGSTSCATTAAVGAVITGEIIVSEVVAALVGKTAGTSGTITCATYVVEQMNVSRATRIAIAEADISGTTTKLTQPQRQELLNALGAQLQRVGFDEHYDVTNEGRLLESIIDLLTAHPSR